MSSDEMTRDEAIELCKDLWQAVQESGLTKEEFSPIAEIDQCHWENDCPLCEWVHLGDGQGTGNKSAERVHLWCFDESRTCPLIQQYGLSCFELGYDETKLPTQEWLDAIKGLK